MKKYMLKEQTIARQLQDYYFLQLSLAVLYLNFDILNI